jgi:hypothetical protein
LCRDEGVLHLVSQLHRGIDPDDSTRTLEGMGGPHQRLDALRIAGVAFQFQQSAVERGRVSPQEALQFGIVLSVERRTVVPPVRHSAWLPFFQKSQSHH